MKVAEISLLNSHQMSQKQNEKIPLQKERYMMEVNQSC